MQERVIYLPDVKVDSLPVGGIAFCPSGEARFRRDGLNGAPLCGPGDLAAPGTDMTFKVFDVSYGVRVTPALASARLRRRS